MLFKEIKRREFEFNNPNKIVEWLNNSNPNAYLKLHEALLLVNNRNFLAIEQYIDNLKPILLHTIQYKTNIEEVTKICSLIEKSQHLKAIYENLEYFIFQINQLNKKKHCKHTKNHKQYNWTTNDFQAAKVAHEFERLSVQCVPSAQTPVQNFSIDWSNMQQPINFVSHNVPNLSLECFGYGHLETTAIANDEQFYDSKHTFLNLTIVEQEMVEAVAKWLRFLKLHKYQWFFNAMSFNEIELIDEDNIEKFITKVNINIITKGAQKRICYSTKTLRNRRKELNNLLTVLDSDVTQIELHNFINYVHEILHYPIPNHYCVIGNNQLQQDLILVMKKLLLQIFKKLNITGCLVAQRLLGNTINKYLECCYLITKNQVFMKDQVDRTLFFIKTLKNTVFQMVTNNSN